MSKICVFLLEDEPMERDLFLEQLQDAVSPEDDVIGASNAMEAIELLKSLASKGVYPVLVFCDLNMPGTLKGFDVLRYLCAAPEYDRTAKLVLSSSTKPEDRDECDQIGATEFLSKALTRMQNMALIMRAVDKYRNGV